MSEKEIQNLIQNLDNDLLNDEISLLMNKMDFDIDSIVRKTNKKIIRMTRMKKIKKLMPLVAACLVAVVGLTTIYANEISNFIRLFSNRNVIHGIITAGDAFYLENPLALSGEFALNDVTFTSETLRLTYSENFELSMAAYITIIDDAGVEYSFGGGNRNMAFYSPTDYNYPLKPVPGFTLTFEGSDYYVQLTAAPPALDFDITPAKPSSTAVEDFVSVGYIKTPAGIHVMVSFSDKFGPSGLGASIGAPTYIHNIIRGYNNFEEGGGGSSIPLSPIEPLIGYGGNTSYEFRWAEPEHNTIPPAVFVSDAPDDETLTLKIPGIIVRNPYFYDAVGDVFVSFELPAPNGQYVLNQTIDLGLQQIIVNGIKRISESTVELSFELNTGGNDFIAIYDLGLAPHSEKSYETIITGGTAVMTIELNDIAKGAVDLFYSGPILVVYGDWSLVIE